MYTAGDDQYSGLFHDYSLGCYTANPGGLHARLCHAFASCLSRDGYRAMVSKEYNLYKVLIAAV